jgi:hypothetical protein
MYRTSDAVKLMTFNDLNDKLGGRAGTAGFVIARAALLAEVNVVTRTEITRQLMAVGAAEVF